MNRIDEDSKICHLEVKAPLLSTGQNAGHKILENVGEILLRTVPRDAPFKVHFKGEAVVLVETCSLSFLPRHAQFNS